MDDHLQPVREAVNDHELFTTGWFGVRKNTVPGWKFTIVYEQTNMLVRSVTGAQQDRHKNRPLITS